MQKTTLLMLCVLTILCAVSAFAQGKATEISTTSTLERYQRCMSDKNCATPERWAIIEGMADEMHLPQLRTHNICSDIDYKKDCLSAQKKKREQRQEMHTHMRKRMRLMEHKNFMEKIVD